MQTRMQLAMGFLIFFIAEVFILGLIPHGVISGYQTENVNTSYFNNIISNIEDLSWWNTLIFAPFVTFVVLFIIGLIPTVDLGS